MQNNSKLSDKIFNQDHEQIVYCSDKDLGLKAIIGIHDTTLGPSIGGTRMWNYSTEEEGLKDVLRLSKAMSLKSSLAGLNAGGGKAVIIGDLKLKNQNFIRKYASFINDINGKYWTAQDVNISSQDMIWMKDVTPFVVGMPEEQGGLGDSSHPTAYGVYLGMKAASKFVYGTDSLEGKKIALQGIGKVGAKLIEYLTKENANIYVSDINKEILKNITDKYKVSTFKNSELYSMELDIFSPCALGAILNSESIKKLKCKIVAGAANNQLEDDKIHDIELKEKNIIYVPDFLINAGGVISVYHEQIQDLSKEKVFGMTENIYSKVEDVLKLSSENDISTNVSAMKIALDRINRNRKK
jgi:leucine dehydrogenase